MRHANPSRTGNRHRGRRALGRVAVTAAVLLLALVLSAAAPTAVDHPTLISLESTACTTCHDDLLGERAVVHPPAADDCTTCHDLTLDEAGTRVALMDDEPALCLLCHDDKAAAVEGTLATPHPPAGDSCLTCHDPHAADHPAILHSPATELCTACHDAGDLDEGHGGQLTPATRCASCHEPHGSDNSRMLSGKRQHQPFAEGSCTGCHRAPFGERIRLRARGEKLCEACHGKVAEEPGDGGSFHPALVGERGRAGCLSCHDPHMSDQKALLATASPELCGECHAGTLEAAGSATGHPPAAEDCLNCHLPHASAQRALLAEPAGELCLMCHDGGDEELAASHLGADLEQLACLGCHDAHGAGNRSLLARTLHPPLEDGCDTCHEGSASEVMEDGESSLCLICHDDIGEAAEQAAVPHAALEVARCADCHNPHASAQDHLISEPAGGACLACHEDQGAGPGEFAHGVIDLIGCRACHEPHGGQQEKLLRATGAELCLSCHDASRVRGGKAGSPLVAFDRFEIPGEVREVLSNIMLSEDGEQDHPLGGHRTLGTATKAELKTTVTTFTGEMTCLTCHDPHKGRSRKLLAWNAASPMQACLNCHPK